MQTRRSRISESIIGWVPAIAIGGLMLCGSATPASAGCPSCFKVLHTFSGVGSDGAAPGGGSPIGDSAGNIYGTTYAGGTNNNGTVWKLTKAGVYSTLYSFGAAPAANPSAG